MANAPCKDCSERHIGCHQVCSKYKEYSAKKQEIYKLRYKESVKLCDFAEHMYLSTRRMRNNRGFAKCTMK